jgi:hypothetical protein
MQAPKKPDQGEAMAQLKSHLLLLGGWLLAVRAAPYALHFLTKPASSSS